MAVVHLDVFLSVHLAHMILPFSMTSSSAACAVQANKHNTARAPNKTPDNFMASPPIVIGEPHRTTQPAAELSLNPRCAKNYFTVPFRRPLSVPGLGAR